MVGEDGWVIRRGWLEKISYERWMERREEGGRVEGKEARKEKGGRERGSEEKRGKGKRKGGWKRGRENERGEKMVR